MPLVRCYVKLNVCNIYKSSLILQASEEDKQEKQEQLISKHRSETAVQVNTNDVWIAVPDDIVLTSDLLAWIFNKQHPLEPLLIKLIKVRTSWLSASNYGVCPCLRIGIYTLKFVLFLLKTRKKYKAELQHCWSGRQPFGTICSLKIGMDPVMHVCCLRGFCFGTAVNLLP
jgi:hypothetical protein